MCMYINIFVFVYVHVYTKQVWWSGYKVVNVNAPKWKIEAKHSRSFCVCTYAQERIYMHKHRKDLQVYITKLSGFV